jgi:hypothetical protein
MVTRAKHLRIVGLTAVLFSATSCSPEFGSDEWCNNLMNKPRDAWTVEEVKGVARYCIAPD